MLEIRRNLYRELNDHLKAPEISLIVGPRQVGKTTLMFALKEAMDRQNEKTLFLNLDVEADKRFFESQALLLDKIKLEIGEGKGYVFIDEIQRKENAGLFLKGIYDMGLPYKLVVSGSGSLELKEKIHESLAGRKRLFELNPVSYKEFVNYKTAYKYEGKLADFFSLESEKAGILLKEYLNYGGYPRVVTEHLRPEKLKILDEIFRSYIEKDIVYLLKVDQPEAFRTLIRILAAHIGNLLNYAEMAARVGVSVQTLKKYLWYAEKTYIVKTIPPFYQNVRKEITKSRHLYFYDLGLRNYALGLTGNLDNPNELGFLFENLIGNLLEERLQWSGASLYFWRTADKTEVDFVINRHQQLLPVEVKYAHLKQPSVKRSLRSFIDKYEPEEAWVINLNYRENSIINKTTVKFMPYYDLVTDHRVDKRS